VSSVDEVMKTVDRFKSSDVVADVCGSRDVVLGVCRFLEVDGECVLNLTDCQLYKVLSGKESGVKVVVLRAAVNEPRADDVESLRDDLSLALMELDALQAENKQLTAELDRCVLLSVVYTCSDVNQTDAVCLARKNIRNHTSSVYI